VKIDNKFDVIVAGGGPAGSTAATLLAQQGHQVLLIDRDRHPRFHIGESMLPMSEPVFQRLGIAWDRSQHLPKNGAEFIDEMAGIAVRFPLAGQHQPYQVERAGFDHMMLCNAEKNGVAVHQQETIRAYNCDSEQVSIRTDRDHYSGRYLIDATGRSAMTGRQNNTIQRIPNLGKFSLYTHYSAVDCEAAKPLFKSGDVKILTVDIGWVWIIPLTGNRLSVGLVVQKELPASDRGPALLERYLAASPMLNAVLTGAVQDFDIKAEADFSFTNSARHGQRFACCGDAAGFLDPVFSSGVFLAIKTAESVADRLHRALLDGNEGAVDLHADQDDAYRIGFDSMRLFVERFYHSGLVRNLFSVSGRSESLKRDIMGLLAGDLWTGSNDFQYKLLNSRQASAMDEANQ